MRENHDGSVTYGPRGFNRNKDGQILPPQNVYGATAGTCGMERLDFCPSSWPTAVLGPIPQTPPNVSQIVKSPPAAPATNNFTECGRYCHGPGDCGAAEADADCVCALPSPQDSRTLGLDPVAPVPVCLVLAALSGFGKRDEWGGNLDERGELYQCPCNSTFISDRCCGSRDGVV